LPRHQLQPRQRQAIAAAQGFLLVALTKASCARCEHQHQSDAIAEDQEISSSQEVA
jgi:hypothetical protein